MRALFILLLPLMLLGQEKSLSGAINQFGFDLLNNVEKKDESEIYSPFSICSALYMVYMGSRGETQTAFEQVLRIPYAQKLLPAEYSALTKKFLADGPFKMSNGLWLRKGIKVLPAYEAILEKDFQSESFTVNFENRDKAAKKISKWVEKQTKGNIKNFVEPSDLNQNTQMFLCNAVYFKGEWEIPFDPKETKKSAFFPSSPRNEVLLTEMMHNQIFASFSETARAKYLLLPFKIGQAGIKTAFFICLPKELSVNPDDVLNQDLSGSSLDGLLDQLKPRMVDLSLPKFSMRKSMPLKDLLIKMGLSNPFSNAADFSGIDGTDRLKIDDTFHQAFLSIDEYGALASAATGISIGIKSIQESVLFDADHPFTFMLLDMESRLILFLGKLEKP